MHILGLLERLWSVGLRVGDRHMLFIHDLSSVLSVSSRGATRELVLLGLVLLLLLLKVHSFLLVSWLFFLLLAPHYLRSRQLLSLRSFVCLVGNLLLRLGIILLHIQLKFHYHEHFHDESFEIS